MIMVLQTVQIWHAAIILAVFLIVLVMMFGLGRAADKPMPTPTPQPPEKGANQ